MKIFVYATLCLSGILIGWAMASEEYKKVRLLLWIDFLLFLLVAMSLLLSLEV